MYLRLSLATLYILYLSLTVALNNMVVFGLPFRSIILMFTFGLVVSLLPKYFLLTSRIFAYFLSLFIISLLLGEINGLLPYSFSDALKILQLYFTILVFVVVICELGEKFFIRTVLFIAIFTSVLGILQALNIPGSWEFRLFLSVFQTNNSGAAIFLETRTRPPGLTLFAVHQGYFLLSALICYLMYLHINSGYLNFKRWIIIALMIGGMASAELRSAFGMGLISVLYYVYFCDRGNSSRLTLTVLAIFAISYFMFHGIEFILNMDSRLVVLNASALDKLPLSVYGINLFFYNPLGWGIGFDSIALTKFSIIKDLMPFNSDVPTYIPLHNAILNYANTFGVLGVLIFILLNYALYVKKPLYYPFVIFFVLNTLTHNAGLFQNDIFSILFVSYILSFPLLVRKSQYNEN